MSRLRVKLAIGVALLAAAATAAVAIGSDGEKFRTGLSGFEENPAVITTGHGSFTATLSNSGRTIEYELSYDGLEGIEVRQAHIHAGQMTANGGIVAWLCQTAANPAPAGVDVATCPTPSGTVTGTIDEADVQAVTSVPTQGFRADANKFDKLVTALRAGRRVRERPHGDVARRRDPRPAAGPPGQLSAAAAGPARRRARGRSARVPAMPAFVIAYTGDFRDEAALQEYRRRNTDAVAQPRRALRRARRRRRGARGAVAVGALRRDGVPRRGRGARLARLGRVRAAQGDAAGRVDDPDHPRRGNLTHAGPARAPDPHGPTALDT